MCEQLIGLVIPSIISTIEMSVAIASSGSHARSFAASKPGTVTAVFYSDRHCSCYSACTLTLYGLDSSRQSQQALPVGLRQNGYRQVPHRILSFGALRTFQGPISFSPNAVISEKRCLGLGFGRAPSVNISTVKARRKVYEKIHCPKWRDIPITVPLRK